MAKTAGAGGTSAFVVWKLNAIAKCPDKRPQCSNRSGRDRPEVDLRQLVKSCQPPIFNFTALSAPRRLYLPGAAFVQGQPMKKLMLVTLASSFVKPAAAGQDFPATELSAGYSVINVVKGSSQTANGGSGSIAFNFNPWLGVVGDLGGYSASPSLTAITYTAGPRFSYRHWNRLTPFAQVLFGGVHASSSASNYTGATNAYAFGTGGGADFVLDHSGRFVLRPQLEYFGFGTIGSKTDTVRVCVGIVFRIPRHNALMDR